MIALPGVWDCFGWWRLKSGSFPSVGGGGL
jgi:hypothetical protein